MRIVLTGGPCGGKTTVIKAVKKRFTERVVVVPEAATHLLSGGFPLPGRDLSWSEDWQAEFQQAVVHLQLSLEAGWSLAASEAGQKLLVCDRGLLDGAAYTSGGVGDVLPALSSRSPSSSRALPGSLPSRVAGYRSA